jgi:arylsulfatase A-like enzyme
MDRPNILLVVMDTARARNALPSANPETMPRLAELASDGVEFTSAISTAPWTLPSHASLFTGEYTSDHGTNAGNRRFVPDHDPLPQLLRDAGYETVAFSNNSWVSPEFGFDRGFDQFHPGWRLFDGGTDLARVMRDYDTPLAQVRELWRATDPSGLPATMANAAYAKFVRKRYDYGAFATNWKIRRWFDGREDERDPFFAFVNYLEPHLEYDPPKRYCTHLPDGVSVEEAKRIEQDAWRYLGGEVELSDRDFEILEGLYDSELGYLDHRIGELFDDLSSRGVLEETVVVVVGDHGENIGDHGLMDHQYCLYDTLLHVPLVVRGGDAFRGGRRVADVVESRDVFPTLLEAAGVDPPAADTVSTNSLSGAVDGGPGDDQTRGAAIAEYLVPQPAVETLRERAGGADADGRLEQYDRALRAVRTPEWKFVEASDGSRELYDVVDDPRESTNLAADRPGVADRLQARLRDAFGPLTRGEQDTGTIDTGARQRLEDLGYI